MIRYYKRKLARRLFRLHLSRDECFIREDVPNRIFFGKLGATWSKDSIQSNNINEFLEENSYKEVIDYKLNVDKALEELKDFLKNYEAYDWRGKGLTFALIEKAQNLTNSIDALNSSRSRLGRCKQPSQHNN